MIGFEDARREVPEGWGVEAAERFTDLAVVEATTTDGRTARVTLRAVAQVPLLNIVTAAWSDGVELTVTARARAG